MDFKVQIYNLFFIIFVFMSTEYYVFFWLPDPRESTNKDIQEFSAGSAREYLKSLTDLGSRTLGSKANDLFALKILIKSVDQIKRGYSGVGLSIQDDVQQANGSFYLSMGSGFTFKYQNLQNYVVKLSSASSFPKESVLLNCHYDTVPDSPGASDDAASCAVMLEIIRVLVSRNTPLQHDLIFLFNGAEENALPGSHGFVSSHPLASSVSLVINLEAAGSGGKEFVFQTTDLWLLKAYLYETPRPVASVVAEEIFQSGIIPSDTDFRIFRDFGGISAGIDAAYVKNGYVYHTKFDTEERIPSGSLQHTGENMLAMAEFLGTYPGSFPTTKTVEGLVYLDFFGFSFSYSSRFGTWLNIVVCSIVLTLAHFRINHICKKNDLSKKDFFVSLLKEVAMRNGSLVLLCGIVIIVTSVILPKTHISIWYKNGNLLLIMYGPPVLLLHAWRQRHQTRLLSEEILFYSSQVEFLALSLILTIAGIRSAFLAVLWCAVPAIFRNWKKSWFALAMILPYYCLFSIVITFVGVLTPIAGRSGVSSGFLKRDSIMACLTILIVHLSLSYLLMNKIPKLILKIFQNLWFLSMALLLLTPLGFQFNSNMSSIVPLRVNFLKVFRTFYNEKKVIRSDAGFILKDMSDFVIDPEIVKSFLAEKTTIDSNDDCDSLIYCGVPMDRPGFSKNPSFKWFESEKNNSILPFDPYFKVENQNGGVYEISIFGPPRIVLILIPTEGEIKWWSLNQGLSVDYEIWNGKAVYMVVLLQGGYHPEGCVHNFSLSIEPKGMDVVLVSQFFDLISDEHKNIISKFPSWIYPWYWTSDMKFYKV